jgi:hypothetical protein
VPALATEKTNDLRIHQSFTCLPNVQRHKEACGNLLFSSMRLIREQNKHVSCFLISGGQPIQDRLSAHFTEMTYPEGPCKHNAHICAYANFSPISSGTSWARKARLRGTLLSSNSKTLLYLSEDNRSYYILYLEGNSWISKYISDVDVN